KNMKVKSSVVNQGHDCPQISMYTIEGALFFGVAKMFESSIMSTINHHPKTLVLRMSKVPYMDTTGESNLTSIVRHFRKQGGKIVLSGLQKQPEEVMKRTGLYNEIGREHIYEHTGDALNFALTNLNKNKCKGCKHFAFKECQSLSKVDINEIKDVNSRFIDVGEA
ncbi:MAG TPA: sodium-independent anion transporter, partial [Pseudoneobacillus sp.]|nr:sodium-independent anion transporter [Pseudoneobacillus sp.]